MSATMSGERDRIRAIATAAKARLASEGMKEKRCYNNEFSSRYAREIVKEIEDAAAKGHDTCEIAFRSGGQLCVACFDLEKMGFHVLQCHTSDRCVNGPCYCETWTLLISWR